MAPPFHEFRVESIVAAPPAAVWDRVSTMAGVNDEFWPFLRMTHPPGLDRLDPAAVPLGRPVFRSWLLLFGVLPVDFDHLRFLRLEPGRSFLESSTMLSQRRWVHERRLEPAAGGCRVTDRVRFVPRVACLGRASRAVFLRIFAYRHRRLRRRFGVPPLAAGAPRR